MINQDEGINCYRKNAGAGSAGNSHKIRNGSSSRSATRVTTSSIPWDGQWVDKVDGKASKTQNTKTVLLKIIHQIFSIYIYFKESFLLVVYIDKET